MSYCNIVWGSNYKSSLKYLSTLHKRIIRIICDLPWYVHVSTNQSLCELNLLSLENINSYQILLFMFSFHNNLLPKSLPNTFALDIKRIRIFTLIIQDPPTIEANTLGLILDSFHSSVLDQSYGIDCLILKKTLVH